MKFKFLILYLSIYLFSTVAIANTPKSIGKYKSWESFLLVTDKGKICFAQTVPTKRAPSSIKREQSRLFVTFRPLESIKNEISKLKISINLIIFKELENLKNCWVFKLFEK